MSIPSQILKMPSFPERNASMDDISNSFQYLQTWGANARTVGFYAFQGAAQSIPNATATKVTFGNIKHDYYKMFNSTNSSFVVPSTGFWLFSSSVRCLIGASAHLGLYLVTNEGTYLPVLFNDPGASFTGVGLAIPLYLTQGDEVHIAFYQSSGGAKSTTAGVAMTYFTGVRLL